MTRWLKPASLFLAATVVATLGLQACKEAEELVPSLTIQVSPRTLNADGTTADVTIKALEPDGTPGQGSVTLSVTQGKIDDGSGEATLDLANGAASAKWGCTGATCAGEQKITADWKGTLASSRVTFTVPTPDAGPTAGTYTIKLVATPATLVARLGGKAEVVATVTDKANQPVPNIALDVAVGGITGALLSLPEAIGGDAGTAKAPTLAVTTGADGTASFLLWEDGKSGKATIIAEAQLTGDSGRLEFEIKGGTGLYTLALTASKPKLDLGVGDFSDITVTATDADKNPVANLALSLSVIPAQFGTLSDPLNETPSPKPTLAMVTDVTGKARVRFREAGATGKATIQAVADLTSDVGETEIAIGNADILIELAVSKSPLFFEGDYSDITATVTDSTKKPLPNLLLTFATADFGGFIDATTKPTVTDAGVSGAPTLNVTTDSTGQAVARFVETTRMAGTANLTVTHEPSQARAKTTVTLANIQLLRWVSTKCQGDDCSSLGLRNSKVNSQAQMTFQLLDSSGNPAEGVKINFEIKDPPRGTTVDPTGTTDAEGKVTTNIGAGDVLGQFVVDAYVEVKPSVRTQSPGIGIRGAKPSNFGSKFTCSKVNLPAFVAEEPPGSIKVRCDLKLVDRFGNAVGNTSVDFKSEAGTLPNNATTVAFTYGEDNGAEGTASITFDTYSSMMPVDVDPLDASLNQFPKPRVFEPAVYAPGHHLTRNPRDSLVTLMAYTKGEEYFLDVNNNGKWDTTEPFIDQGEPFIDANDNNVYDPDEQPFDTNGNGLYDGPDGTWNENTTIWVETRVLYTGLPEQYSDPEYLPGRAPPKENRCGIHTDPITATCSAGESVTCTVDSECGIGQVCDLEPRDLAGTRYCGGGIQHGSTGSATVWLADRYLNRLTGGTLTAADLAGGGGDNGELKFAGIESPGLLDGFGIDYERVLLDKSGSFLCNRVPGANPGDPVKNSEWCVWKTMMYGFSGGNSGGWASFKDKNWECTVENNVRKCGAKNPCQNDLFRFEATVPVNSSAVILGGGCWNTNVSFR